MTRSMIEPIRLVDEATTKGDIKALNDAIAKACTSEAMERTKKLTDMVATEDYRVAELSKEEALALWGAN